MTNLVERLRIPEGAASTGIPTSWLNEAADEIERLQGLLEVAREALNDLYISCPTSLECHQFHHAKRDRHSALDECKPREEYLSAIKRAHEALAKIKGEG